MGFQYNPPPQKQGASLHMRRYELGKGYDCQTDLQINSPILVVFGFLDLNYLSGLGDDLD